jgi:hypothetical protein
MVFPISYQGFRYRKKYSLPLLMLIIVISLLSLQNGRSHVFSLIESMIVSMKNNLISSNITSSNPHDNETNSWHENRSVSDIKNLIVRSSKLLGSPDSPITIILYLTGEMGNFLSKIAYAYSVSWILQEEYNVTTKIIIRHQSNGKWKQASKNVQACFPSTRHWSFTEGNTEEYEIRNKQQQSWLQSNEQIFTMKNGCIQEHCIRNKLKLITTSLLNVSNRPVIEDNYNISLPFITVDEFATISFFNDRYASRIAKLLWYDVDDPNCCGVRAEADESVIHLRNFLVEMPRKGRRKGYEELSPSKVANEIFANLTGGDKVAMTSRLTGHGFEQNYTLALQARGLVIRVIENQSPMQDFCFLLSATKDFIGCSTSTYAVWAAYLGNATKSRLYSVKSPDRIAIFGDDNYFFHYNWSASTRNEKVRFESYNSEEQDIVEREQTMNKTLNFSKSD